MATSPQRVLAWILAFTGASIVTIPAMYFVGKRAEVDAMTRKFATVAISDTRDEVIRKLGPPSCVQRGEAMYDIGDDAAGASEQLVLHVHTIYLPYTWIVSLGEDGKVVAKRRLE